MRLDVVTPEGYTLRDVQTDSVTVPTSEGALGILWNHAPLAATLGTGILRYHTDDGDHGVAITGGYFDIVDNVITVLADAAELDVAIDVARAMAAKRRAETRLHARQANIDRARAEAALQRSLNRIRAAGAPHVRPDDQELHKQTDR